MSSNILFSFLLLLSSSRVYAHPHEILSVGATNDPIDGILWAHIIMMCLGFGIIFPTGMVLGLAKSKWHVPVQCAGLAFVGIGFVLGHAHEGRQFSGDNIHRSFSSTVILTVAVQAILGVYLKLHLERVEKFKKFQPYFVKIHEVVGILIPFVGYVQMVFGVITALGWCRDDHIGQCLDHFLLGSAFMAYGILLILSLRFGLLRSKGISQDYFDSWIITIWGFISTWSGHRWNEPWTYRDYQRTALGFMWWIGGVAGIYFSRSGKRSLLPGLIIFLTGWAMSSHDQSSEVSTKIHANFGYSLISAGLSRIVEVCFFVKDDGSVHLFQQLTPYLLVLSGVIFTGANEEQIYYLDAEIIDPQAYCLVLAAISFFVFLGVNLLIDIYWKSGVNWEQKYGQLSNNPPLPLNTGRTVMNTNSQDSPTSSNNYEFSTFIAHNHQYDDEYDGNEK